MPDLRFAGVGWPVGAVDVPTILALPSPVILMCATEGRYHADAAVRAGKRVIWRAIPRHDHRPAELGYNARRFADEVMNLTDEPTLPIRELISWNELDLNSERGNGGDDWSDLDGRYTLLGQFQLGVLSGLRQRLPGVTLHYGAWTPDHDAIGHIRHWIAAAQAADVIDFHAYDTLDKIRTQYEAYRAAFPDKRLFLAEWHGKGDLAEERRILTWLAETAEADPLFDGAAFFIWDWPGAPGWWSTDYDIAHNHERLALFMSPPNIPENILQPPAPEPAPLPEPEAVPVTEIEAFIRDAATKRGIDPDIAVKVARSEGGVTEPAAHGDFETGDSWWPFQLHYGGPGYEQLGTVAGMGNGFTVLTGWQAGDPAAWRDSVRYALNRAKASGWSAWYGAAAVGVAPWDGIDQSAPWDAAAEPWDYEAGVTTMPDRVTYNREEPAIAQNDPWSCSVTSARWALTAVGRHPDESWFEGQAISDGVVSRDDGLLDASGAGLAAWITAQYAEYGYSASSDPAVSFAAVAAEIGPYPLLLGGRAWGHWSGLRGYDLDSDVLLLANPAAGWKGVGQIMTRQQFAALGPFSLVRVLHPDLLGAGDPPAVATPVPPVPDPLALIRERYAAVEAALGALREALGV